MSVSTEAKRIVCWFSCGAASAVATKLAIAKNAGRLPLVIAYTEVAEEHPDNKRFLAECEKWFGCPITVLRNDKYEGSCDKVFLREKYLVGPSGAPCTRLLKRQVRAWFEEKGDIHVFGFTVEEQTRAEEFRENNPHLGMWDLLLERQLTKADCLGMLEHAGIELPTMYLLGYRNNNCIGCVKGGAGYWNKIRVDFPDRFSAMAKIERTLGASILRVDDGIGEDGKRKKRSLFLDELPSDMGRHQEEPDIGCGIFCKIAQQEYA